MVMNFRLGFELQGPVMYGSKIFKLSIASLNNFQKNEKLAEVVTIEVSFL